MWIFMNLFALRSYARRCLFHLNGQKTCKNSMFMLSGKSNCAFKSRWTSSFICVNIFVKTTSYNIIISHDILLEEFFTRQGKAENSNLGLFYYCVKYISLSACKFYPHQYKENFSGPPWFQLNTTQLWATAVEFRHSSHLEPTPHHH